MPEALASNKFGLGAAEDKSGEAVTRVSNVVSVSCASRIPDSQSESAADRRRAVVRSGAEELPSPARRHRSESEAGCGDALG